MSEKIRIIEAANQLSLGGTEYALQTYSKYLNKDLFDVKVVAIYKGGERVKLIEELGIEVIQLNGDFDKFDELLTKTDVFHWHGDGTLDKNIFERIKKNKPKLVIQTNVFGYFDNSSFYNLIDYDLYISKMILVRRMELDKKSSNKHEQKRKVLSYPVDINHLGSISPSDEDVLSFKKENNLLETFVVGRIGRSDDHKFDLITLDGFAELAKLKNNVKFLLVGSTPKIVEHAKKLNILDKMLILETSSDLSSLLVYYKSLDVFVAASNIGESFGMVIAEAMFLQVPVVTINTPDRDNAQIELVDNGVNGFVVPRLKNRVGAALIQLYDNRELKYKFSKMAKYKITDRYSGEKIVLSLEQLIIEHLCLKKQQPYISSQLFDFSENIIKDYRDRCNNLYGGVDVVDKFRLGLHSLNKKVTYNSLKNLVKQKINLFTN
jgi:glycosyltransferase involved in cell wall biosynthesis